jgi:hypothetical protein
LPGFAGSGLGQPAADRQRETNAAVRTTVDRGRGELEFTVDRRFDRVVR